MLKDTTSGTTILLAEDDAQVRNLVMTILTQKGYSVLNAENGVEALNLLGNNPAPVKVLLTDVDMPLMNGIELAQNTRRMRPEIKIVAMSGVVPEQALQTNMLDAFVPKPFLPNTLLRTVESVLSQA